MSVALQQTIDIEMDRRESAAGLKSPNCQLMLRAAQSICLTPANTNIAAVEAARIDTGSDLAILYDVSPAGVDSQTLSDQLSKFPKVVVCDHHNACAPIREVQGKELTAAEVVIATMPQLNEAGLLGSFDSPAKILILTNSMNVDPDAFVSRFLIQSYLDPVLRESIWQNEDILNLLVEIARYGDTTFFGGVREGPEQVDLLKREAKIALALFQLIDDEKEKLVVDSQSDKALIGINAWPLLQKIVESGQAYNASIGARHILRSQIEAETAPNISTSATLEYLRKLRGSDFITLDDLKFQTSRGDFESTLSENASAEEHDRLTRRRIISYLPATLVKEVFVGRNRTDIFGKSHAPLWNPERIDQISATISEKLPILLADTKYTTELAKEFLSALFKVREYANQNTLIKACPEYPERKIAITLAKERLDRESNQPFYQRYFRIYDWLREASAAFGDPWLHIMDRNGAAVVSSRFAPAHEKRPNVNLAHPEVQNQLLQMEETKAKAVGAVPTKILIKANLWLAFGPLHLTKEELTTILFENWDKIMDSGPMIPKVEFPTVKFADSQGQFDGARFALLSARASH